MKPAPFEYHAAQTTEEAVTLLAKYADRGGRVIAGGQSFVPMMAFRLARPSHLIDINRIAGLDHLAEEGGVLRIGATVRHSTFETATVGGTLGRLLHEVARSIAHRPIRNRGTFCGSIVNADPAAEWCLTAATLGAEVVAHSARGSRIIAASQFLSGVMTTVLAPDELVTECRIPLLPDDVRYGFYEVSRRAGDFAMAAALAVYRLDAGCIAAVRIGIGGVEPVPRRIADAETALTGAAPGDFVRLDAAAEAAARAVEPMKDGRNSPAFRRQLVRTVVRRALERALLQR